MFSAPRSVLLAFCSMLLALCPMLFASPARAEMLLVEFGWSQPNPVTLPAVYGIHADGGSSVPEPDALWLERVEAFGHESWAEQQVVDLFTQHLGVDPNDPDHRSFYGPSISMGIQPPIGTVGETQSPPRDPLSGQCLTCAFSRLVRNQADALHTAAEWQALVAAAGWEVTLHVPLSINSFNGYTFTRMRRVVTAEKQTVTFWGVVPEPTTLLLVTYGVLHLLVARSIRLAFC